MMRNRQSHCEQTDDASTNNPGTGRQGGAGQKEMDISTTEGRLRWKRSLSKVKALSVISMAARGENQNVNYVKEGKLKVRIVTKTVSWEERHAILTNDFLITLNDAGEYLQGINLLDITECSSSKDLMEVFAFVCALSMVCVKSRRCKPSNASLLSTINCDSQ
jgi:hypothetical protein